MVFDIAMKQRIGSYHKREADHCPFKIGIVNDINTKNWQAAHHNRQKSTVKSAPERSGNTHYIPIDLCIHLKMPKIVNLQ